MPQFQSCWCYCRQFPTFRRNHIWSDISTTEGKVDHKQNLSSGMQDPPKLADTLSHDGHIVACRWLHSSHRPWQWGWWLLILSGSVPKRAESGRYPRRWFSLVKYVDGYYGCSDSGEGGLYEGQVSEKEVQGRWKCGAEGDGNDNKQISQYSK